MSSVVSSRVRFEPFLIDHLVDGNSRFDYELRPDFPFSIKLYSFSSDDKICRLNWHQRLELFVPVAGRGRFRMGRRAVDFSAGDVLIVDNLSLHGLSDFRGPKRKAMVITFLPNLIVNPSSCLCDYLLLSPFYSLRKGFLPVMRSTDHLASEVHGDINKLVDCYTSASTELAREAGCKAYLMKLLYHLSCRYIQTDLASAEYQSQQEKSKRFEKLYEWIERNHAEKMSVAQAASFVAMSQSQFMKLFKETTGMTFVAYHTKVRLNHAYRLLIETDASVTEVAYSLGFCDQSYFTRKFREAFGFPPSQTRPKTHPGG